MKTATITRKPKTTNPSVTANNLAPHTAAAKKPATARSTTTGEATDKHPAKADVQPAQLTPIAPQLPTEKIRASKQAKLIAELRAAPGATIKPKFLR